MVINWWNRILWLKLFLLLSLTLGIIPENLVGRLFCKHCILFVVFTRFVLLSSLYFIKLMWLKRLDFYDDRIWHNNLMRQQRTIASSYVSYIQTSVKSSVFCMLIIYILLHKICMQVGFIRDATWQILRLYCQTRLNASLIRYHHHISC